MSDPVLRVKALSHRYGGANWAVKDVSFDLLGAGITGLLGSNGAGKSTCMNAMCGVLYPTSGDILINGHSVRKAPLQAKRNIGFLPQQAPLYSEFTVHEYLTYCARLRRMRPEEIDSAVEIAKQRVGVSHFSKRLIGSLSGGYRQRVGLAQAILHRPSLVILDEPTTGLDPNQLLSVRDLIREIGRDHTVLLSTHILSEVEVLCDDIKMIEQGRIVFEGPLEAFSSVVEPQSLIASFATPIDIEVLKSLPGVNEVEGLSSTKYRIRFSDDNGVSRAVIETAVQESWPLREITYERANLEDVFAEISQTLVAGAQALPC